MQKNLLRRMLSLIMVLAMALTLVSIPAFADGNYKHLDGTDYSLQKVSNPEAGEGEVDGLMPGGDRASSYCWAMAENAGHLYIGTWANGLWQMVVSIGSTGNTLGAELTQEAIDKIAALVTHGEVDGCEPDSYYTAKIFRYNEETGEVELLFDPGDYPGDPNYGVVTGFRAGVEFKGDVYMDALLTGRCLLYRVTDENPYDLPEIVFENGTLRAMCVSLDKETMFVGGSSTVPAGYLSSASIFATTTGNAGDFAPVADEEDFAYYTKSGTTADISDMITFANPEYKDGYELIATLGTAKGLTVFRGHAASDAEIAAGLANKHGWVWTEFAGDNGEYPISFGNPIHCNLNPVVFNDELYFLTMTNPMTPLIYLFAGLISNNQALLYSGIDQVALTCDNECSVYRLKNDGTLQMVMGDKERCDPSIEYVAQLGAGWTDEQYGTTMYAWRGITYNDRLYVNTIDYWNLFSYVTQLTNGELLGMSEEDFKDELGYLVDFIGMLLKTNPKTNAITDSKLFSALLSNETVAGLKQYVSTPMYNALYALYKNIDKEASTEFLSQMIKFSTEYSDDIAALCDKLIEITNSGKLNAENCAFSKYIVDCITKVKEPYANIAANKVHIQNYMIISDTVANEKYPGGEVWCTTDGITWEAITRNGFNDKYNHGIRTFALGNDGSLYFGCANPYYGAQLWKCIDNNLLSDENQLAAPEISATKLAGKPRLTWNAVDGATKYVVYRATSSNGEFKEYYTTKKTSYTNTSATPGYTYYYKVKAITADGIESAFSDVKSVAYNCAQPVAKITTVASSGKPKLTWSAVDGATKYEIYRATSKNGTYTKMYTTSGTSYTNTSALAGKTYYYKVKAISGASSSCDSDFSAIKYITCDCARPVVKITTSSGHPKLSWAAVDGATKYEVYRATSSNGIYTKLGTTSNLSYTNTGAKAGKTYYYKVKAVCGASSYGNSAYSTVVSIKAK